MSTSQHRAEAQRAGLRPREGALPAFLVYRRITAPERAAARPCLLLKRTSAFTSRSSG